MQVVFLEVNFCKQLFFFDENFVQPINDFVASYFLPCDAFLASLAHLPDVPDAELMSGSVRFRVPFRYSNIFAIGTDATLQLPGTSAAVSGGPAKGSMSFGSTTSTTPNPDLVFLTEQNWRTWRYWPHW